MYDAFISYSRGDLPTVQRLKQQLDERRLRVFLDLDSLHRNSAVLCRAHGLALA